MPVLVDEAQCINNANKFSTLRFLESVDNKWNIFLFSFKL